MLSATEVFILLELEGNCRVKLTIYFKLFGENGEIATFSGLKVSSKCGQTRIPRVKLAVD